MVKYPFSNGTEGYAWQDIWCDECAKDHDMHHPDGAGGCPILLKAVLLEPVEEWDEYTNEEGQFFMPPAIMCREFVQCEATHDRDIATDGNGETHRDYAARVRLTMPTILRLPSE